MVLSLLIGISEKVNELFVGYVVFIFECLDGFGLCCFIMRYWVVYRDERGWIF